MRKFKHSKWLSLLLAIVMIFSSMSSVVAYADDSATDSTQVEVDMVTDEKSQDETLEPTLSVKTENVLIGDDLSSALDQSKTDGAEDEAKSSGEDLVAPSDTVEDVTESGNKADEPTLDATDDTKVDDAGKIDSEDKVDDKADVDVADPTDSTDQEEPKAEEPKSEDPVDEQPVDEKPVDENTVEGEPVEGEPVEDGSGDDPIDLENRDPDVTVVLPFEFEIVDDGTVNMETKRMLKASMLRASNQNVPGDVAVKGTWDSTTSSFVWTSIPGYTTDNVRSFSVIDANGNAHQAFCIDSDRPSGVGMTAHYAGTFTGIGAKALYAIYRGVGAQSFTVTTKAVSYTARNGEVHNYPAQTKTVTISKNDVILSLRWLAWTNNGRYSGITPSNSTAAWNDFYNLANAAGTVWPELYFNTCRYMYEYYKNGRPWTPSADQIDQYPLIELVAWVSPDKARDRNVGAGSGGPMLMVDADTEVRVRIRQHGRAVTPDNYTSLMGGDEFAQSRADYASMINGIVNQMYAKIYSVANAQGDVTGYVWSSGDGYQRFVTFEYVPQAVKVQVIKSSTTPSVSDDNAMYKFAGIRYEVIVDGQSYGYVTLGANGESDVFEFPDPREVVGKTATLKEVNDATQKASGYAVGNSGTITLANGLNTINVSDPPITDPPALRLQKVDSETGESYDKLGI